MNYTWQIMKLGLKDQMNSEGQLLEDAIVYVHWKKIAQDSDGNKSTYTGETELSAVDVPSDSFINLNIVSKEDVIQWIEGSLSPSQKNSINTILAKKIEKNKLKKFTPSWG